MLTMLAISKTRTTKLIAAIPASTLECSWKNISYRVYGWAAFFLVIAALNLAGGSWYLALARSVSART